MDKKNVINSEKINNETFCICPEMPYCPGCPFGYIEYFEENDTDTVWHCLNFKEKK